MECSDFSTRSVRSLEMTHQHTSSKSNMTNDWAKKIWISSDINSKHKMAKLLTSRYFLLTSYTACSTKLKGGILVSPCPSVCPSVCEQNRVCSVSFTILVGSISYPHILSSNLRRCVLCKHFSNVNKWKFWQILKICNIDLSCFDLGSNMS